MATTDAKHDLLFLLGAGASKDAGMPLASEITERIVTDIERTYPCLLPLLRFVQGGICFGRVSPGASKPATYGRFKTGHCFDGFDPHLRREPVFLFSCTFRWGVLPFCKHGMPR